MPNRLARYSWIDHRLGVYTVALFIESDRWLVAAICRYLRPMLGSGHPGKYSLLEF